MKKKVRKILSSVLIFLLIAAMVVPLLLTVVQAGL